jgi:hypothetical protein
VSALLPRSETLVLAACFRHFCLKTTADIRCDLSVNSEFHPVQLMRQLNMENHISHSRSSVQPQGLRRAGTQFFNAADSDIRLPPSRERGFLDYSFLVAGSIQARRSPIACRVFDTMRSLADEVLLGMATLFVGNQRGY